MNCSRFNSSIVCLPLEFVVFYHVAISVYSNLFPDEAEAFLILEFFPGLFQHLYDSIKPIMREGLSFPIMPVISSIKNNADMIIVFTTRGKINSKNNVMDFRG